MRVWFLAAFVALLAPIHTAQREPFKKYDAAAIRRFDDELRHLGVVLPSLSKPDDGIDPPDPVVSTVAGDFEGYWTKTQFGRPIAAFEGIPYAQPPVGPLRFKVAQPLTQRLDHFVAKAPGSMCYQRNVYIFSPVIEGQEDCLFINVYAPDRLRRSKNELLPVMFWIHGGGFLSGEGALYQPNILLDRDVVLVTFNYRLGPLGFLTTEDGTIPGNLGLKDQVAALRWVRDNIAAFGGNPDLVTVFGQSAGGVSTEFHRMSPLSSGLFHRSVSISGQTSAPWALAPPGETKRHRDKAAKYWNCPTQPSSTFLKCLNSKTGEEITGVDRQFIEWGISPFMPFKPVIEGDVPDAFLPFHPNKHYADGIVNDVPYMMGMTSEEGAIIAIAIFNNETQLQELNGKFNELLPKTIFLQDVEEKRRVSISESIRRAYFPPGKITKFDVSGGINIYTDFLLFYPLIKAEQRHKRHAKSPLYTWLFSYEGHNSYSAIFGDRKNRYGVCHGDDLIYLFSLPALFGEDHLTPRDVWMSIFMTEMYTNFARDGVPSSSLTHVKWKPTTAEEIDYLHIQGPRRVSMQSDMLPERWRYVEEVTKEVNGYQYKDEL